MLGFITKNRATILHKEAVMKVILLADVKGTGKKNDVVEVSDGYARNCLLKKKLAIEATSTEINAVNNKIKAQEYYFHMRRERQNFRKRNLEGNRGQTVGSGLRRRQEKNNLERADKDPRRIYC